jgi:hypothetical protein
MQAAKCKFSRLMVVLFCLGSSLATADEQTVVTGGDVGGYIGIQFGNIKLANNAQYNPDQISSSPQVKIGGADSSFLSRVLFGYQFNPNVIMEAGYNFPTNNTYSAIHGDQVKIKLQDIDVLGGFVLPLRYGFKLNFLAGAAYLKYREEYSTTANLVSNDLQALRPQLGAAIAYNITPNWQLSINLNRIQGKSNLPNITKYTFGITYNMVELYCGQFLC